MKYSNNPKHQPSMLGMVTVNDKGQVVIPASARATINLQTGDKLLVMMHPSHEGVVLIRPDGLETFAKQMLEQLSDARQTTIEEGDVSG